MSSVILTLLRGSLTFNSIIVVISKYTSLTLYIDGFLNVISLAAILNFAVSQREAWNQGISGGVGIHHLRITHNTPCLPPPPPHPPPQNFANAFFTRCFQQNIFRTFMGSINTESTLGRLFFITCMRSDASVSVAGHIGLLITMSLDWTLNHRVSCVLTGKVFPWKTIISTKCILKTRANLFMTRIGTFLCKVEF